MALHPLIEHALLYRDRHCNSSPADSARYRIAIEKLIGHKELIVEGPNGERRRRASTIDDKDALRVSNQTILWPLIRQ